MMNTQASTHGASSEKDETPQEIEYVDEVFTPEEFIEDSWDDPEIEAPPQMVQDRPGGIEAMTTKPLPSKTVPPINTTVALPARGEPALERTGGKPSGGRKYALPSIEGRPGTVKDTQNPQPISREASGSTVGKSDAPIKPNYITPPVRMESPPRSEPVKRKVSEKKFHTSRLARIQTWLFTRDKWEQDAERTSRNIGDPCDVQPLRMDDIQLNQMVKPSPQGDGATITGSAILDKSLKRLRQSRALTPSDRAQVEYKPASSKPKNIKDAASPRSLDDYAANPAQLPPFPAILGMCADGLPLVLSLLDPEPGSILVVSDDSFANRRFLQSVLTSIYRLNGLEKVWIDLVTARPDRFGAMADCVFNPGDNGLLAMLKDRFAELEQTKPQQGNGQVRLLVIDQLENMLVSMEAEDRAYFRWLVRRGPEAGIWIIAAYTNSTRKASFPSSAQRPLEPDLKTMRAFNSILLGRSKGEEMVRGLTRISMSEVEGLEAGEELLFSLRGESEAVKLRLAA